MFRPSFIVFVKTFSAYKKRNHRLSVEVGQWFGIPITERRCNRCASEIGDEYYYLLICPYNKVQLTNLC